MVGLAEEHPRDVRHGKTDEADRAAESRYRAGQQRRREKQQTARTADIQSHRYGIFLAEEQEVERFDRPYGQQQPDDDRRKEDGELRHRHVAERPHRPDDERL